MFAPQRCCPHCQGLKPCDTKQQRGSLRCNSHDLHMQKQNQHQKNNKTQQNKLLSFRMKTLTIMMSMMQYSFMSDRAAFNLKFQYPRMFKLYKSFLRLEKPSLGQQISITWCV